MPYITETLYQELYKERVHCSSVHQTQFSAVQKSFIFDESAQIMSNIIELIAQVRRLKTERQLSLKVPLSHLAIHASPELLKALAFHEQLIKGITHAVEIEYKNEPLKASSLQEKEGVWQGIVKI